LDARGSPWAVRWFCVVQSRLLANKLKRGESATASALIAPETGLAQKDLKDPSDSAVVLNGHHGGAGDNATPPTPISPPAVDTEKVQLSRQSLVFTVILSLGLGIVIGRTLPRFGR